MKTEKTRKIHFSMLVRLTLTRVKSWRTMVAPLRQIHGRICPLEFDDKLTNVSARIQDTTDFSV